VESSPHSYHQEEVVSLSACLQALPTAHTVYCTVVDVVVAVVLAPS
jgi:hypothetical protein